MKVGGNLLPKTETNSLLASHVSTAHVLGPTRAAHYTNAG